MNREAQREAKLKFFDLRLRLR